MNFEQLKADQLEYTSEMLRAMAHPVRIAILNLLDNSNKLTVTEIHEQLKLEQAPTSHHLGILKNKGILGSKRDGKNTYYFIKNKNLTDLLECLNKCAGCPTPPDSYRGLPLGEGGREKLYAKMQTGRT